MSYYKTTKLMFLFTPLLLELDEKLFSTPILGDASIEQKVKMQ